MGIKPIKTQQDSLYRLTNCLSRVIPFPPPTKHQVSCLEMGWSKSNSRRAKSWLEPRLPMLIMSKWYALSDIDLWEKVVKGVDSQVNKVLTDKLLESKGEERNEGDETNILRNCKYMVRITKDKEAFITEANLEEKGERIWKESGQRSNIHKQDLTLNKIEIIKPGIIQVKGEYWQQKTNDGRERKATKKQMTKAIGTNNNELRTAENWPPSRKNSGNRYK